MPWPTFTVICNRCGKERPGGQYMFYFAKVKEVAESALHYGSGIQFTTTTTWGPIAPGFAQVCNVCVKRIGWLSMRWVAGFVLGWPALLVAFALLAFDFGADRPGIITRPFFAWADSVDDQFFAGLIRMVPVLSGLFFVGWWFHAGKMLAMGALNRLAAAFEYFRGTDEGKQLAAARTRLPELAETLDPKRNWLERKLGVSSVTVWSEAGYQALVQAQRRRS